MNPKGIGSQILPGNMIVKIDSRTGEERLVDVGRTLGYFWEIKDLRDTDGKSILSNTSLVPAQEAQVFPRLENVVSLTGETANLPDFFIRNANYCTLVTLSYKQYGNKLLSTWIKPFAQSFSSKDEVSIVNIAITEGSLLKLLRKIIIRSMKNNTPIEEHANFLTYFGDATHFRDCLRMHNSITCYVVLLDGIGRVRWMGSGKAEEEEVDNLLKFASELVRTKGVGDGDGDGGGRKGVARVGKKIPKRGRK